MVAPSALEVRRYKSVVYLNNAAVTFLSGGHVHFAQENLSDVLTIIKSLVQGGEEETLETSRLCEDFIRMAVKKTEQRLAKLDRDLLLCPSSSTLSVVSFDGSLSTTTLESEICPFQQNCCLAILIDDVSTDEILSSIQEVAPTILLSNFALTHWFEYRKKQKMQSSANHNRTADGPLRMLDLCRSVLGVEQRTMDVTEGNLFLAIAVTNNACCIQQQQQYEDVTPGHIESDALLNSRLELALLQSLSNKMTGLKRLFVSSAGAA